MLAELTVIEQRYPAVREVLDTGARIIDHVRSSLLGTHRSRHDKAKEFEALSRPEGKTEEAA